MNVFDLICILLLAFSALLGYRRGILRVVLRIGGYIVAAVASRILAPLPADPIYDSFLKKQLESAAVSLLPAQKVTVDIGALNEQIYAALTPRLQSLAESFHLLPLDSLPGGGTGFTFDAAGFTEQILRPIVTKIVILITGLLFFILFSVILGIIITVIYQASFAHKKSLLRTNDRIGGAILGVIKAAIPVVGFCLALTAIAGLTGNETLLMLSDGSLFCRLLSGII